MCLASLYRNVSTTGPSPDVNCSLCNSLIRASETAKGMRLGSRRDGHCGGSGPWYQLGAQVRQPQQGRIALVIALQQPCDVIQAAVSGAR
jgi:hypothetical protein